MHKPLLLFAFSVATAGPAVAAEGVRARSTVNPPALVTIADYPPSARRAGEEGTVGFALDITADGRVSACTIEASSGSAALDAATCRIMRSRARFEPARDSGGQPIPDHLQSHIRWILPR